ncbi:unnamed protein product [Rotaria magnacalcarata]
MLISTFEKKRSPFENNIEPSITVTHALSEIYQIQHYVVKVIMMGRRIHVNIVASLIMFMLLLIGIRADTTMDTTQMSDTSMQAMTNPTTITIATATAAATATTAMTTATTAATATKAMTTATTAATATKAMTTATTATISSNTTVTTTKSSSGNVQQELINMPLLFMVIIFLSLAVKDI